jgi:hypothetical protein
MKGEAAMAFQYAREDGFWVFADGTRLPIISGGTDDPAPDPTPDPTPDPDPADLGEAGKKALEAERAARKAAEKAAKEREAEYASMKEKLEKFEADAMSESEKAIAKARKEAEAEARTQERERFHVHLVRAEVRAAAGGKLADPEDAVRMLDLSEFKVTDDGEVDGKAISKSIEDLLKSKPYLAAKAKGTGNLDGGARTDAGADDKDLTPGERLRRAYSTNTS